MAGAIGIRADGDEWRRARPLALLLMVTVGFYFSFGIFFTPLLHTLHWTRSSVSSLFTVFMIVYVGAQAAAGALSDRFGPPSVIGVGGMIFASGFLVMGFVSVPWQAYVAYGGLMGVGFGGLYVPIVAAAGQEPGAPGAAGIPSARVLGFVTAGSGLGILLVGLLADQVVERVNVHWAYWVLGASCAALVAALSLWLRRQWRGMLRTNRTIGRENTAWSGLSLSGVVRQARTWVLVLANTGLNVAVGAFAVHGVAVAQVSGIGPLLAGAGLLWAGFGRVVGSLVAGRSAGRGGLVAQWQLCVLLIAAAMVALAWPDGILTYYAACFVFGLGFGGTTVIFPLLVANLYGGRRLGSVFGFLNLGYGVGGGLGPLLVGWLFDVSGAYWPGFLAVAGAALLAVLMLSLLGISAARAATVVAQLPL